MPRQYVITFLIVLAIGSLGISAYAEDSMLSAREISTIITGKTITLQSNGESYKAYFDQKGKYTRIINGKPHEGTYNVTSDGVYCIRLEGKETCAKIRDNGDSTYTCIENGKITATWIKVVAGRDL